MIQEATGYMPPETYTERQEPVSKMPEFKLEMPIISEMKVPYSTYQQVSTPLYKTTTTMPQQEISLPTKIKTPLYTEIRPPTEVEKNEFQLAKIKASSVGLSYIGKVKAGLKEFELAKDIIGERFGEALTKKFSKEGVKEVGAGAAIGVITKAAPITEVPLFVYYSAKLVPQFQEMYSEDPFRAIGETAVSFLAFGVGAKAGRLAYGGFVSSAVKPKVGLEVNKEAYQFDSDYLNVPKGYAYDIVNKLDRYGNVYAGLDIKPVIIEGQKTLIGQPAIIHKVSAGTITGKIPEMLSSKIRGAAQFAESEGIVNLNEVGVSFKGDKLTVKPVTIVEKVVPKKAVKEEGQIGETGETVKIVFEGFKEHQGLIPDTIIRKDKVEFGEFPLGEYVIKLKPVEAEKQLKVGDFGKRQERIIGIDSFTGEYVVIHPEDIIFKEGEPYVGTRSLYEFKGLMTTKQSIAEIMTDAMLKRLREKYVRGDYSISYDERQTLINEFKPKKAMSDSLEFTELSERIDKFNAERGIVVLEQEKTTLGMLQEGQPIILSDYPLIIIEPIIRAKISESIKDFKKLIGKEKPPSHLREQKKILKEINKPFISNIAQETKTENLTRIADKAGITQEPVIKIDQKPYIRTIKRIETIKAENILNIKRDIYDVDTIKQEEAIKAENILNIKKDIYDIVREPFMLTETVPYIKVPTATAGKIKIGIDRITPKTEEPSRPSIFSIITKPVRKTKEEANKGFVAMVRRKGKFVKVTPKPLNKNDALSAGARTTDETIAAEFKIKPVKVKKEPSPKYDTYFAENQYKFRPYRVSFKGRRQETLEPDRYVEKRHYRLDKPSETKQIKQANDFGLSFKPIKL